MDNFQSTGFVMALHTNVIVGKIFPGSGEIVMMDWVEEVVEAATICLLGGD